MSQHGWMRYPEPYAPPDWDEAVVHAIRALRAGTASPQQQQIAWNWLMYVTGAGEQWADLSPRPGMDGALWTYFVEGKRYVGIQMLKMCSPIMIDAINIERQRQLDEQQAAQQRASRGLPPAVTRPQRPAMKPRQR